MHSDFTKQNVSDMDLRAIRYKAEYWRKFINAEILIRSIYDKNYPGNSFEMPGYFKTEVYDWYHNGLEVRAYPFAINARLKDEGAEVRLEVFGCIPFENIIAYDLEGDEYYNYPHLFCDYPCGADPYEEIRYRREGGYIIDKDDIIEVL